MLYFNTRSNSKYIYKLDNRANSIVKQFVCNYLLILTINILEVLFTKIWFVSIQKIYKLIYSILVSRVTIFKKTKIKFLLKYIFRYLYYLFIKKDLLNNKLDLFNNIKLYKKLFNTKINKLDILEDKNSNKIVKYYILLK